MPFSLQQIELLECKINENDAIIKNRGREFKYASAGSTAAPCDVDCDDSIEAPSGLSIHLSPEHQSSPENEASASPNNNFWCPECLGDLEKGKFSGDWFPDTCISCKTHWNFVGLMIRDS